MVYTYVRNEDGDFVCPHCQKVVCGDNQSTMHYHLKKHAGDLPHECKHCKDRFPQLDLLRRHERARHPDKRTPTDEDEVYECPHETCHYSSLTKANRRIHYFRVHMKDIIDTTVRKTDDKYICNTCNKEMNSHTSLYYHIGDCIQLPVNDNRIDEFTEVMT